MPSKNICERFASVVAEDPHATAVFDSERSLTRAELDALSDQIASQLPKGVARVGVAMSHGVPMIATILGILKAGAAYVPVEPDFPEERINYMMENAQVDCVITSAVLSDCDVSTAGAGMCDESRVPKQAKAPEKSTFAKMDSQKLVRGCDASSDSSHMPASTSDPLAYILYTSGTTGKPKGVMVTHANVCHYIDAFANEFHPTPDDVMMQHSVCSFDIFVEEVFSALLCGMTLAIPSHEDMLDIDALMDFVSRTGTTIISGFPYLLQEMNALDGIPESLRLLISGGDILRARYVDRLIDKVEVYNTYGPSETTVCASYFRCRDGSPLEDGTYPIGKAVLGTDIAIMDELANPVPEGTIGELVITGDGVSEGYVGSPPEQANFFTLPDGRRAYRSGDLGYFLPDGNIAFLHRKDMQVMIDGRRVEPTEVESVLCECSDVASGVVRSYIDSNDMPYLVAYYVPKDGAEGDLQVVDARLRSEMSSQLAPYMVPEFFVSMRSLPLTPNGKVDTRALPRVWKAVG